MWLTLAFLAGVLCGFLAGVLLGAVIADTLAANRARRRRYRLDLLGSDAIEAWLAGLELPKRCNGDPFPEEEPAA